MVTARVLAIRTTNIDVLKGNKKSRSEDERDGYNNRIIDLGYLPKKSTAACHGYSRTVLLSRMKLISKVGLVKVGASSCYTMPRMKSIQDF